MVRETFGQRLKRLRLARGLSQRKLAGASGLTNGAISQAESESLWIGQLPSLDILRRLARALNTSVDVLAGDEEEEAAPNPRWTKQELLRRIGAYPIIDLSTHLDQGVGAGTRSKANIPQGLEALADIETIPLPDGQMLYALRVSGGCMEPKIEPGDTVRFDPELPAEDGDLVVAAQDGERALVKWLDKRATLQRLISLNEEPIMIDEHIEIVGVVRDIVKPPPPRPRRKTVPKVPEGQRPLPEA